MPTDEQLQQINSYIAASDVPYYDVGLEIADHLTEQVLATMEKDGLAFEDALEEQGAIFRKDWPAITQNRSQQLRKQFLREAGKEILQYLHWPKLSITLVITAPLMLIALSRFDTRLIRYVPLYYLMALILVSINDILVYMKLPRQMRPVPVKGAVWSKDKSIHFGLLIGKQVWKMNFYSTLISSLSMWLMIGQGIWVYNPVFARVLCYYYPVFLIVYMAWNEVSRRFQNRIRQDYPEFN
jgi:hypothetical protein